MSLAHQRKLLSSILVANRGEIATHVWGGRAHRGQGRAVGLQGRRAAVHRGDEDGEPGVCGARRYGDAYPRQARRHRAGQGAGYGVV